MTTITMETGVLVSMRDGVRLATDIYRPADAPTPTLLTRSPNDKGRVAATTADDMGAAHRINTTGA